jgi:hypothetical protein
LLARAGGGTLARMRHPFTRRNGRRLLALTALAAAAVGVPTAVASPWEDGVRAGSLGHSLANVIGGVQRPLCLTDAPGRWTCVIPDPASRTMAEYRLRAYGRCWSGRRDGHAGQALPRSVRGCVGMWDQLRIADRL